MTTPPAPSYQVLAILSRLVEERAGLHYGDADLDLLAEKLAPRALEAGFESLLDYYYFLRYDPAAAAELDALVDVLVVNETYFFRELDPLRVVVNDLLVPQVLAGARPRVWCAACATGEEPLTLAMLLDQRAALDGVELVASDICQRVLDRARRGEYGRRAVRALPDGVVGRWLDAEDDHFTVRPALRAAVRWERVNLVEPAAAAALGQFDVILCRNVLIYFSDETTRRVVEGLTAALRPGGYLLVGASESLLRLGTSLRCVERGGAFFYVKAP